LFVSAVDPGSTHKDYGIFAEYWRPLEKLEPPFEHRLRMESDPLPEPTEPLQQPPAAFLVVTTLNDREQAQALARSAVEQRLAACVHLLPAGQSIYRWEGHIESATETTLLLKTTTDRYPALESWLKASHPYQTPEILALPVTAGLPSYLEWMQQCCH